MKFFKSATVLAALPLAAMAGIGLAQSAHAQTVSAGPVVAAGNTLLNISAEGKVARTPDLAVFSAGAYAMSMASQYNSRGRPAEVVVQGDQYRVVRQREIYEDLTALEMVGLKPVECPV